MVYFIQFCWHLASRIRMELCFPNSLPSGSGWNYVPSWSCSQAVSKTLWHIPLLCVRWKTPDDGQTNCPIHVDSHSKNKFEKLVHIVGFIIQIKRVFWFSVQLLSEPFYRSNKEICETLSWLYIGLQVKYPIFFLGFNKTYIFDWFSKRPQTLLFIQIRPIGAELFHMDRETDRYDGAVSRY